MMAIKSFGLIVLLLFYRFSYSQQPLRLGDKIPLFVGNDHLGNKINLEEKLKVGSVVILFYRGQWCPHCTRHMNNLQDSLKYITGLGASVIAITPENNENIDKTVAKTEAAFSIIYDEAHKIMDAYKVTFRRKGWRKWLHLLVGININKASGNRDDALPVPATYIVNREGVIIGLHFDKDYTVRMPVKVIADILQEERKK